MTQARGQGESAMSVLDSFLPPSRGHLMSLSAPAGAPDEAVVNRPVIPDPAEARPPQAAANNDRLTIRARPFARPDARVEAAVTAGLRVLPLAGFSWAGTGGQPRSRGDHVLIWRPADAAGSAVLRLPGGLQDLPPGEVRFLPAGTAFSVLSRPDAQGSVLLIPREAALRAPVGLPQGPSRGRLATGDSATLVAALAAIAQGGLDAGAAACHLGLAAAAIGRADPQGAAAPPFARPPAAGDDRVARVLLDRFVTLAGNELGRGRTLADLAAALGVTTAELDRTSHALRGCGALDLVYALRRERAITLLRETREPPQRIAERLGFASLGHMTRMLSEATGRGPDAYRRGG